MRRAWVAVVVAGCLALVGCADIRVHRDSSPALRTEPAVSTTRSIALGAKTLGDPTDLSYRCPSGWASVRSRKTFTQALLTVLTLNLYSPWTVETECRKSAS